MGTTDWDLAGFTDLNSRLGKKIDGDEIELPKRVMIDEKGERLVFDLPGGKCVRPAPEMLNRFVRLWHEPDESIRRYAEEWGYFRLGEEGRPCNPDGVRLGHTEPIQFWRYFSRRANAVLDLAAVLQRGKKPKPELWEPLGELRSVIGKRAIEELRGEPGHLWLVADRGYSKVAQQATVEVQRSLVALEVSTWLKLGRVGFLAGLGFLQVDLKRCLFSAIALQLALTIAGANSLFTCSGCGSPYVRHLKAPKPGQANFCERCGRDEALRHADRRRREKIAAACGLHAEGLSAGEIAKRLEVRSVATVRRWIKKGK